MIKTKISVNDGGVQLTIDVRLWRDQSSGRGIAALDPVDPASRALMIEHRGFIKAALGQAHNLSDVAVYESQSNGLYTPGRSTMHLHNGASLKEADLSRMASEFEAQGWRRCQDLSQHQLPPAPEP